MSKIKALYITNLGLLDNLAKTQILPYLEGLSRTGVDLHILSFEKSDYLKNSKAVMDISTRLGLSGMRWSYLKYHNRWGNAWDILVGFVKSLHIIMTKGINVLHARASVPILMAWPLARMLGLRVIYDRRGTLAGDFIDDVNVKNIFSTRPLSDMLMTLDDFLIAHSDATIVLSEEAVKLIRGGRVLNKAFVSVVPCCVDLSRFNAALDRKRPVAYLEDRFVINYLGSLGTCYLLEEMACFVKTAKKIRPDTIFFIISHSSESYINKVLTKEGLKPLDDYVIMDSSPGDVPGYIYQSDCSMMFIKQAACKTACSPTKFGESLAMGIPVIINKGIGDTEQIVRERRIGVVVDRLDEKSYLKAMEELTALLTDNSLEKRCVDAARDLFSLDVGVRKYVDVYDKIMRPKI